MTILIIAMSTVAAICIVGGSGDVWKAYVKKDTSAENVNLLRSGFGLVGVGLLLLKSVLT